MLVFLWVAFATCAILDWWCMVRPNRRLEAVVKPAAMLALVGVAIASGALGSAAGVMLVVALAFCTLGDVMLLGDSDARFRAGLTSFLVGHVGYAVVFLLLGLERPSWAVGAALLLAVTLPLGWGVVRGAQRLGGTAMGAPVAVYIGVIGAMTVLAWMTGSWVIALGASTFLLSDLVLGHDKFVAPQSWARLAIMVLYLVAQAVLVVGVLGVLAT